MENKNPSNWYGLFSCFLAYMDIVKFIRCENKESLSGHDFLTYPPFSSMSLEGVKIVRVCRFCGKIMENEVKGLAKMSLRQSNERDYAN
jgi:hypothetical protein